ncbi:MAG: hypothetical protein Q9195_004833 [Heterodermia aff. obscurata]
MKNVPQDMGLAPGTLIMPTGMKRPSFFGKPKERLRLEWYRLRARVFDFMRWVTKPIFVDEAYELNLPFSLFAYKFTIKPGLRGRPKFQRRKIVSEAVKLHSQMYTAFAEYVLPRQSDEASKDIRN